jgi:hypothetical protein
MIWVCGAPLELLMPSEDTEKHLLAGVDERQRGFARQVDIESMEGQYRASLHYEKIFLASEGRATKEAALMEVIEALQKLGYRQLRSRLNFRGNQYLGGPESWLDYPDPEEPAPSRPGTLARLWYRLFPRIR